MTRLTRVRMECIADTEKEADLFLVEQAAAIKNEHGGSWHDEDGGIQHVTATKDRVWSRLTIRRDE